MFLKKIRQFLIFHKILFIPLSIIVLFVIFFNFFIDKHAAYLTGEQVFSFDYTGHLKNIVHDLVSDKSEWLKVNDCIGCPDFYHYSRWYSLVNLSIFSIGELLHIHPFIFYIFLIISVQLVAVYISFRLLFKKVQWFAFLVTTSVFIILPINFLYLGSGLYAFHHAFLLLFLSLTVRMLRNIEHNSFKKIFQLGILAELVGFFFLNVSIGFLPIFLYSFAGVLIFFYQKWVLSWKKIICFVTTVIGLIVFSNLPMVISVLLYGNPRIFFSFLKLNLLDSFTAGLTLVPTHLQALTPVSVAVFFYVVVVLLIKSNLNRKQMILLVSFYFFVAILLSGDIVFDFLFRYFPLLSSLRSLHRIIIFEELILSFVVYSGLKTLWKSQKILAILLSFILISILSFFIKENWGYLNKISVPNEYFQADTYLSQNLDKKIYFPAYLPIGQSINDNYSWSLGKPVQATLYQNPFTSLFAVPNLITLEGYPIVSQKQTEMRALFDYVNDPEEILKSMEDNDIKYVIVDNNFLWKKNFPNFDIGKLVERITLEKSFEGLSVYKIQSPDKKCKKSYGNYAYGFCHIKEGGKPDYLINTSKQNYLLETYIPKKNEFIPLVAKKNIYSWVSDPTLQMFLINKKVAYSDVLTLDNQEMNLNQKLFSKKMEKGTYNLIIPLLKINDTELFFGESVLNVYVDDIKITSLIPHGPKNGIAFNSITLNLNKRSIISLGVGGKGYVIIKKPFVLSHEKYNTLLNNDNNWHPHIIFDKTLSRLMDSALTINSVRVKDEYKSIDTNDKKGLVKVNLLNRSFVRPDEIKNFQKTISNNKVLYGTREGEYFLDYNITGVSDFERLSINIGTYFLNTNRTMNVSLLDGNNNEVFRSESFMEDQHLRKIELPLQKGVGLNGFTLRISFVDNDGPIFGTNLYSLNLVGEL